jgi:hypothetical protein
MKGQLIGYNALGKPLALAPQSRVYHHHIIGSSGGGKSKFLESLMRGDVLSGQGFCLIDPHGTLYSDVLKFCAYRVASREIILLNLSEPQHIVGFNFFTKNATGKTNVQVDNLIQATLHAWDAKNADSTPTLGRTLKVIYTSMLDAGLTLPQIAQLLDFKSSKLIKEELAAKIENDLIRREWLELASLSKLADFRNEILSTKNRLFPFLTSETLLQFVGIKGKTIDLTEAMNRQKIILVNLAPSEDLSREEARLFGSLLVNQFFQAALRRKKDAPGNDPRAYQLYLDEFQNFVSIDLCNALDEVRKFGLFLNLSHQRFGQLNEDIEDAVLANCRIKTVFGGLRTDDARRMAEELFIGKLDPLKIKAAIYQTKHWYKYVREKVYTRTTSRGESETSSSGRGSGTASGISNASLSGQTYLPPSDDFLTGAMWFGDANPSALSESSTSGFSSADSSSEFSGESHSASRSESEGVADIPVFVPVPYQELSSVQYYTPDEQLLELTQALKLQQQRHCFVQLPNQETQPLLVPLVKDFYVSKTDVDWYVQKLARRANALTPEEANRRIFQDRQDLLQLQNRPSESAEVESTPQHQPRQEQQQDESAGTVTDEIVSKTTARNKKKATIFDHLKEANPELDLDG